MSNMDEQNLHGATESVHCVQSTATLESFVWEDAPSLSKDLFLDLAGGNFIAKGENVIFCGPAASGKTHLSNALATIAQKSGYSVNLVAGFRLDTRFAWQFSLEPHLISCDLLLIDEPEKTTHLAELLRARQGRSTMLLTTLPAAQLLQRLLPTSNGFEPLREAWSKPIVVEFKENTHGRGLRTGG
jgi:DNA replication protein DnaC